MLSAWGQTWFSVLQIKEHSLQPVPGLPFDPDKPPRRDNPLKRPHSLPAAGSYSFILIIRQTPPLLSFCGQKPLRHKEDAVKIIKRLKEQKQKFQCQQILNNAELKGLDAALQDMRLTEYLPKDLWALTFTCHLEAGGAYQKAPFGGLFWRTQACDRAEANCFDRDSREPLALILTLKHAHVHKHTHLWSADKHTWYRWLRACSLFISSPAVFFLSLSLVLFFF